MEINYINEFITLAEIGNYLEATDAGIAGRLYKSSV